MVASWVSGWIVVMIPQLGAGLGPVALCFMMMCTWIGSTMNIIWPPICRLMKYRNYLGPNDFVSDCFNSHICRLFCSFSGLFSTWCLLVIEWIVLKMVASWMFRPQIESDAITSEGVVWMLVAFIYACETVGGMESVAITDAVQCTFLMAAFISVVMLIEFKYGGFVGFFGYPNDPENCQAKMVVNTTWPEEPPGWGRITLVENQTSGEPILNMTEYGCVIFEYGWWLDYPPIFGQALMLWIPIGSAVLCLSPAGIHRAMISGSDDSFRRALAPVHCEFPEAAQRPFLSTVTRSKCQRVTQTIRGFSSYRAS